MKEKEQFVLELLDETKRLVTAWTVLQEGNLGRYEPPGNPLANSVGNVLHDRISASLLTAMMVMMGYRIPNSLYSLPDLSPLCDWLGATEEDGKQKWQDE